MTYSKNLTVNLREFLNNDKGAAAVEFAFMMPLIIVLFFAIFNFSIFFFGMHQAQRATETSARAVRMLDMPSEDKILAVLRENLKAPIIGTYMPEVQKIEQHAATYADIQVTYSYILPIPIADKYPLSVTTGSQILLRELP